MTCEEFDHGNLLNLLKVGILSLRMVEEWSHGLLLQ